MNSEIICTGLFRRRRSCCGAVNIHGHPLYDKLQRVISPIVTGQSESCGQEARDTDTTEHEKHHTVDLGELRGFVQAFQDDVRSSEMIEIGAKGETGRGHRRCFSVDLGEVREFISLREMRAFATGESTARAGQSDVQEGSHHEVSF